MMLFVVNLLCNGFMGTAAHSPCIMLIRCPRRWYLVLCFPFPVPCAFMLFIVCDRLGLLVKRSPAIDAVQRCIKTETGLSPLVWSFVCYLRINSKIWSTTSPEALGTISESDNPQVWGDVLKPYLKMNRSIYGV